MVEFQNDTVDDAKADALAIASAYRAASDDDTRNVMNAMSNPSLLTLDSLKFYIVPKSWFLKAWPLLTAKTHHNINNGWRESIGRIQNGELLNVEREVSSSEDENATADRQKKRFEQLHLRMQNNRQRVMKTELEHTKDYFFIGPSAWLLVKEKFGYDGYELARSCSSSIVNGARTIAIQLLAEESDGSATSITIPPSGRFAYEKILQNDINDTSMLVPEERQAKPSVTPLFDNTNSQDGTNEDEQPILLLPASTTPTSSSLYPSVDDMDVEGSEKGTDESDFDVPVTRRKRLASGLGNLGNTCFMNSTLQCLAHTEPLRKYFLSGEYEADLNRDNPLGTGGELATQFASLLREMWGLPAKRRNVLGASESNYANSSTSAVYPRPFKSCLGKHAEQFMGYDQHDSQEFATYLLDALHEDTNRITKKPYIEKPEQEENESDDVAANKAWNLHLQREDSHVLENFMGQIKSRLECCEETCNRVSTTFDPCMYLSVPIPGATERVISVTFVPLDPHQRMMNFELTVPKTSDIEMLMSTLNQVLIEKGIRRNKIPLHDLLATDVWSNDIYKWYQNDDDTDKIRNSDKTYIYELRPLAEVQEASKNDNERDDIGETLFQSRTQHKYRPDLESLTRLNKEEAWQDELEKYIRHRNYFLFNPRRTTIDEMIQFHKKLENFIDMCQKEIPEEEPSGLKRTRDESDDEMKSDISISTNDEIIQGLVDRSDIHKTFRNAKTKNDVAILEFCSKKFRQFILKLIQDKKNQFPDGITICVSMKSPGSLHVSGTFESPLVLRIPSNISVYELRKELAMRLTRSMQSDEKGRSLSYAGESTAERRDPMRGDDQPFGSPELLVMRQVPMVGKNKASTSYHSNKSVGMIITNTSLVLPNENPGIAKASDPAEKALVSDVVGPNGSVILEWTKELCKDSFDINEYESTTDMKEVEEETKEATTTVLDCIEKYCQMEQLEETEMWYCNRCKKHVKAWKQFHLYRAPPILIVHLKRFHYSALSHRRDKITSLIDFPLEGLDLREMVSHYTQEEKPVYDLYAVSNHYGGLGGGHYTAYILSDDGKWCYYDDSRVSQEIDPKEVVSEAAYVLYYRRRDVPVGQDIVEQTVLSSHMISETVEDDERFPNENAGNISPLKADDDDDMAVDGRDDSSRTSLSVSDSMDADNLSTDDPPVSIINDFPLQ